MHANNQLYSSSQHLNTRSTKMTVSHHCQNCKTRSQLRSSSTIVVALRFSYKIFLLLLNELPVQLNNQHNRHGKTSALHGARNSFSAYARCTSCPRAHHVLFFSSAPFSSRANPFLYRSFLSSGASSTYSFHICPPS